MRSVNFQRTVAAAHRLHQDPGKCSNVHGHNLRVDVRIDSDVNADGFVVHFDHVKQVIDLLDHALVLDSHDPIVAVDWEKFGCRTVVVPFPPTTENMAEWLAERIARAVGTTNPHGGKVTCVLHETDGIAARAIVDIEPTPTP